MATKFELSETIDLGGNRQQIRYSGIGTTARLMVEQRDWSRGARADYAADVFFWVVDGKNDAGEEIGHRDFVARISAYTKYNGETLVEMNLPSRSMGSVQEIRDFKAAMDVAHAYYAVSSAVATK